MLVMYRVCAKQTMTWRRRIVLMSLHRDIRTAATQAAAEGGKRG
jgi:hypothetical protein